MTKYLRKCENGRPARAGAVAPRIVQSPCENGRCENFNSKLRDEFLSDEILYSLQAALPNSSALDAG